ncbi:hypothetical protein BLOT_012453 [Blomia tropicalis]|nr:hypothetical protein BLOT_012453 [Blomia tropicalis]
MFWIKWDNEKFILQKLCNPDFYIKRKFHSVLLKMNKKMFKTNECFVFSGIDSLEMLANLFDDFLLKSNKNINIEQTSENAEISFNRINVWRDSKGSIQNIRQYINDVEIMEDEDTNNILADDPGMGKSTTLVQLYYSKLKFKKLAITPIYPFISFDGFDELQDSNDRKITQSQDLDTTRMHYCT